MKNLDLAGKVSIITGAAQGIGKSIAESLGQNGSSIALIDINEQEGLKLRDLIRGKSQIQCEFYKCNVSNFNEVQKVCLEILKEFKKVDNLILNAGLSLWENIEDLNIETWNKIIDVNLNGAFYFILYLLDTMILQKKGNVILIASVSTITGSGGGLAYPASKSGVLGIAKGICYQCLKYGIRANVISPGAIDTPLLRKKYPLSKEGDSILADQVPLGRVGTPEDIANTALFLASDLSNFICGQEIIVDGGRALYSHAKGA